MDSPIPHSTYTQSMIMIEIDAVNATFKLSCSRLSKKAKQSFNTSAFFRGGGIKDTHSVLEQI